MPNITRKSSPLDAKIPAACSDELAAVEFLESQRWGDTPCCPRCGDTAVTQMKAKDGSRNARFLWRCKGCKQQYTVRVGTIMEDSPIALRHWCLAFYRAAASKKGVSALQIQGETGLSYKSALFLMHRIRWAMAPANENESKLTGVVEFDETYVGGKPRYPAQFSRGPAADFADRKTAVVGGIERDGRVKARVVRSTKVAVMADVVRDMVEPSAHLMTDESVIYKTVGQEYASHQRVKHRVGQYVRYAKNGAQVTTNRIEGFWAGLKRQIGGTHHSVSRKHLHRYVSEAEFKYNNRTLSDADRMVKLIQATDKRRLTYAQLRSNRAKNGDFIYGAICAPLAPRPIP
jgi:transposase-like protein